MFFCVLDYFFGFRESGCVFLHHSCRMSFVSPLVFFLRPVSCFRGRPPLVHDVPLCFCCLAHSSRALFQRWVSSGHFPGMFFFVFRCLGSIFWCPGGLLCSFFASWIRKGTYLCQLAPPDHQLGGKWGHKVDFCPSPGVVFRTIFLTFSYFSEFCDFVKIELPCRRELGFEGPGRSKCHFFSFGTPSKNRCEFGGS